VPPTVIYIAVALNIVEVVSALLASSKLAKLSRRRGVWTTYESGVGLADKRCCTALILAERGCTL